MIDFDKYKGKYVFISHPYSNDPKGNKRKVEDICKYLKNKGMIPISPLHLFAFYEGDEGSRDKIMEYCYHLMDKCVADFMFGTAPGCLDEARYARKIKIPVIKFYPECKMPNHKGFTYLMQEKKGVEM